MYRRQLKLQHGFLLLPVVLALTLTAAIAYMLNREGGMSVRSASSQIQIDSARYYAEAGMNHARWRMENVSGCTSYTDLPSTAFETGSYSATINPKQGSPVTISATGIHGTGATKTLTRTNIQVNSGPVTNTLHADQDTFLHSSQQDSNNGRKVTSM
jgi:hypothetical protein